MTETKYIRIEELKVLEKRLLQFRLSYSKGVQKYFLSDLFYVQYDRDISNVSESILYIPVISNVITVAWAIGADIYVKELDRTYLESLGKIKSVMKEWYPKLSFSTNINAEKIVSNSFSNKGYGLLFSGGIDSTVSYIRHKDKKPNLIMVEGADIPLANEEFWRDVENKYSGFADQENVKINFIKADIHQFINERLLNAEFGRYLTDFSWWGGIHHGICLSGLCAPLSVIENIGTIFFASTHTQEFTPAWGSHPLIDNEISWGDVKIVHDGYELSRQEKIRIIKNYIENTGHYPSLRVCLCPSHDFNCGKCEKCLRTITALVLENIDPTKCGFNVDKEFFSTLKQNFIKGRLSLGENEIFMWKDIQRHIPETMSHNLYDSKEFFEWFKDFDISGNTRAHVPLYLRFYYKLSNNVRNVILRVHAKITAKLRSRRL